VLGVHCLLKYQVHIIPLSHQMTPITATGKNDLALDTIYGAEYYAIFSQVCSTAPGALDSVLPDSVLPSALIPKLTSASALNSMLSSTLESMLSSAFDYTLQMHSTLLGASLALRDSHGGLQVHDCLVNRWGICYPETVRTSHMHFSLALSSSVRGVLMPLQRKNPGKRG